MKLITSFIAIGSLLWAVVEGSDQPNIVMILADDFGWHDIGKILRMNSYI